MTKLALYTIEKTNLDSLFQLVNKLIKTQVN